MKHKFLIILMSVLFPAFTLAQEIVFPVLPGFRIKTNYPVYTPGNLRDYLNDAADIYLSYGFVDLNVAEYKKRREIIRVEVYRHSNNTMAFGAYSTGRSPSFSFTELGTQGYNTNGSVNFLKGNYYVKIKTLSSKTKTVQAAETLASRVDGMLGGDEVMPSVLSEFPADGRKLNEEIFISENVLGHSFLRNAFRASYETGPDKFSIFIIPYSSPEAGAETVNTYVASTGIDPVNSGEGRYVLSDGYNGTIFLAGKGNRVVIISGLARDQADLADKYVSEILK